MKLIFRIMMVVALLVLDNNSTFAQSSVVGPMPIYESEQYLAAQKSQGRGRIVMTATTEEAHYVAIMSKEDGSIYKLYSESRESLGTTGTSYGYAYFVSAGDYYIIGATTPLPVTFNGQYKDEDDKITVSLNGNYMMFHE